MSLFECRVGGLFSLNDGFIVALLQVKLFREWFSQWSTEQKESFVKQIKEIDSSFADKLNAELQNGISENGDGVLED